MALLDTTLLLNDFRASAGNPVSMAIFIFNNGGWIAVVWTILVGLKYAWFEWITTRYVMKNYVGKYVLLAVDVPKNSEQTPKAAEQMFAHFHGIAKNPIFPEKWGLPFTEFFSYGFVPPNMSVEIASLGGYVQFFVRCLIIQRDIIESAIYAQYPDAEITEVEDYVDFMPKPRELEHQKEWDCWSAQINFLRHSAYPIRTYPFFEHSMSQKLIDPMGALLEIMSRISPDEQIWIQWCLQQEDFAWREKAQSIVNKLIGKKGKEKGSPWEVPRLVGQGVREAFTASLIPPGSWETQKQKKDDPPSLMLHLSPGERDTVTQIEMKLAKIAFKVKGRFIYWGKITPGPDGRKAFNKAKGVNGVVGALKQYAIADSNIFTFSKLTKTSDIVFLKQYRMRDRKRRNLYNYHIRSVWRGREAIYMNVEEMASIFHFPTVDVKAGQVQKSETKRGGAPVYLPTETPQIIQKMRTPGAAAKASAPSALPTSEPLTPPPTVTPVQSQPAEPAPPQPQIPTNLPFIE